MVSASGICDDGQRAPAHAGFACRRCVRLYFCGEAFIVCDDARSDSHAVFSGKSLFCDAYIVFDLRRKDLFQAFDRRIDGKIIDPFERKDAPVGKHAVIQPVIFFGAVYLFTVLFYAGDIVVQIADFDFRAVLSGFRADNEMQIERGIQ